MSGQGYTRVSAETFLSFPERLAASELWRDVETLSLDAEGMDEGAALLDAPVRVMIKTLTLRAVDALMLASRETMDRITEVDDAWDRAQRLLHLDIARGEQSEDAEHQGAATTLREALLKGGTTAQTQFSYGDEVEFARGQLKRAKKPEVAGAIAQLGVGERLREIEAVTERFAALLDAQGASRMPSVGRRRALRRCVGAFDLAHELLGGLVRQVPSKSRRSLGALLEPFEAVLSEAPTPLAERGSD